MNIILAGRGIRTWMVVERYNRFSVVHHRRHKDFPGFDIEFIKGAGADEAGFPIPMDADDFVSGVQ